MLKYNPQLKTKARTLRITLTDAEQRLWERLRRKQILGVQFYRQKPIGNYIVDFYAPAARLGSGSRWLPSSLRSCTSQTRQATQHILGAAALDGSTFRRPPGVTTTGNCRRRNFSSGQEQSFFLIELRIPPFVKRGARGDFEPVHKTNPPRSPFFKGGVRHCQR